jgi:hypothetical protein
MVEINVSGIELLSTKNTKEYLSISAGTLNNWRCGKSLPIPYENLGDSVRYKKTSLDAFVEKQGEAVMREIIIGFKSGETYVFDGSITLTTRDKSGVCIDWCFERDEIEYLLVNKTTLEEC